MCFRPGEVAVPVNCPSCGKKINPVAGNYPPFCPWCDAELDEDSLRAANPGVGAAAPGQPSAPGAPKAPGAPRA